MGGGREDREEGGKERKREKHMRAKIKREIKREGYMCEAEREKRVREGKEREMEEIYQRIEGLTK